MRDQFVHYGQTNFHFVTIDDDVAMEDDEMVILRFYRYYYHFSEELETAGEFIRDMAFINIIDDDGEHYKHFYT